LWPLNLILSTKKKLEQGEVLQYWQFWIGIIRVGMR